VNRDFLSLLYKTVLSLVLVSLFSFPVLADTSSRDSSSVEQARFEKDRQTKEETRLLEQSKKAEITEPQEKEAPQGATVGPKFLVSQVKIIGNYSISSEILKPIFKNILGKEVSLAQIQNAVREIKSFYRSKGFIATYAYVPEQDIDNGVLKVDIMEGRLGKVKVSQTKWFSEQKIGRLLRLKRGEILTYEALRRGLTRLNQTRDIKTNASLEAGKESGSTDVLLNVEERQPFHLSGEINNQGTSNTGKTVMGSRRLTRI